MLRVTIIGDGAMATVCAQILAAPSPMRSTENCVTLWARNGPRLAEIAAWRENRRYLPGIRLTSELHIEPDERLAFHDAGLIVCALPTQFIRASLERLAPHISAGTPVVSVAKGIEIGTLKRPSQIILEILGPRPVAALSGPNIAGELARQLPATMVVAAGGKDERRKTKDERRKTKDEGRKMKDEMEGAENFARQLQELFTTPYLRVYRNDDLLGVELAGALKNVIAIAAGIVDGMGAGNNAKAALLTRGLVEITRLGTALGAKAETFMGLAGLGDLVTTCVSPEGRNRTFGERIGKGEKAADVLASIAGVVEGVATCKSVVAIARAHDIDMPISEGLSAVLFDGRNPKAQLAELMARESKRETAE